MISLTDNEAMKKKFPKRITTTSKRKRKKIGIQKGRKKRNKKKAN